MIDFVAFVLFNRQGAPLSIAEVVALAVFLSAGMYALDHLATRKVQ